MKLSKLKLWNYRCFGSEEQVILIDQLTTFIGNNSAGKTAALSALNCMFSENSKERVEKRCGTDIKGRFVSMTYDAFAKNILDHFLYALPDELRPATDYLVNDPDIIDAAFHCAGFKNPNGFTQSRLKTEYY